MHETVLPSRIGRLEASIGDSTTASGDEHERGWKRRGLFAAAVVRGELPSASFRNGIAVYGFNNSSYVGPGPGAGGFGVYGLSLKGHGLVGAAATAAVVDLTDYQVFLTDYTTRQPLSVTARTVRGFTVEANSNGTPIAAMTGDFG